MGVYACKQDLGDKLALLPCMTRADHLMIRSKRSRMSGMQQQYPRVRTILAACFTLPLIPPGPGPRMKPVDVTMTAPRIRMTAEPEAQASAYLPDCLVACCQEKRYGFH